MKLLQTDITCRLDSLPWSRFHTTFSIALGITWVLDAFEIVIVSAILRPMSISLSFTPEQGSLMVSGFLFGALLGSFLFGYLADKYGRKRLFILTLLLYSLGTFFTGFSNSFELAFFLRVVAGAGIGGEFAAIHSAIDEFIPSRHRGKVDGLISALWNLGSVLASLAAIALLTLTEQEKAWRFAFLIGGILAILTLVVRVYVPESPRWLLSKGQREKAQKIVEELERKAGGRFSHKECQVPVFQGSIVNATGIIFSKYRWRFLFSASMSITILSTYYSMITLIPVVFPKVYGFNSEDVPQILLWGSLGGLLGGTLVAFMSDIMGRKATGLLVSLLSLLFTLSFIPGYSFKFLYLLYSFVAFSFASVAYVSAMEIYPSYIRAYAIGLISIVGRAFGFLSPYVLVSLSHIDYRYSLLGVAFFWLLGFLSFLLWSIKGVEAKGKSIEDIT